MARSGGVSTSWNSLRRRRVALFVVSSIARHTRWAAFEQPGPALWDELRAQWDGSLGVLGGGEPAPGPGLVATAIADAIEAEDPPLRIPVGTDAELIAAVRATNDDAAFEATMRATLGLPG